MSLDVDERLLERKVLAGDERALTELKRLWERKAEMRPVPMPTEECPWCRLTVTRGENTRQTIFTLTDPSHTYQISVSDEERFDGRWVGFSIDPDRWARQELRRAQRNAGSCRCNGFGVLQATQVLRSCGHVKIHVRGQDATDFDVVVECGCGYGVPGPPLRGPPGRVVVTGAAPLGAPPPQVGRPGSPPR